MTKPKTLKEAAQIAVTTHNVAMFSRVVDQLRNLGFNYADTASFFAKTTGIDRDAFEGLAYEADSLEGEGRGK